MALKKIIISEIAEEAIGRYFEEYRTCRYGNDLQIRAFNYSRMRSILVDIDAFLGGIYAVNEKKYIDLVGIGTVEFSMEDNQSEILIRNIYFKNL
jgi:hypothetical protein